MSVRRAALVLVLVACGGRPNAPTIQTDRDALRFGQEFDILTYVGTSRQDSLLIENIGLQPLTISGVVRAGDDSFSFIGPLQTTLVGGDHTFVTGYFTPTDAGTYSGTLTINSDAENMPAKVIDLSGRSIFPPDAGPDAGDAG